MLAQKIKLMLFLFRRIKIMIRDDFEKIYLCAMQKYLAAQRLSETESRAERG